MGETTGRDDGIVTEQTVGIDQGVSGADASVSGATGGADTDPNSAAGEAGQVENATLPVPELIPRGVMDAEVRKVQSAGDKQINELRQQLSQLHAQQAPQNQSIPGTVAAGDSERYDPEYALKLAEESTAAAFEYQHKHAVADANRSVMEVLPDLLENTLQAHSQKSMQLQQSQGVYAKAFNEVTAAQGLSQEEIGRAQDAAYRSMQNNLPTITPEHAVMIGRFGTVEAALSFAGAGYTQAGAAGATQTSTPAATMPLIPGQPPIVPNGGAGNVLGQGVPPAETRFTPQAARQALR